jgi:hypothetical protein
LPAEQTSPLPHFAAQVPQLFGSTFVSAHEEPHSDVPPPQVVPHFPCEHTCPEPQAVAHVPQLALSVCTFTHEAPHIVPAFPHEDVTSLPASVVVPLSPQPCPPTIATPIAATAAHARCTHTRPTPSPMFAPFRPPIVEVDRATIDENQAMNTESSKPSEMSSVDDTKPLSVFCMYST